MGKVINLKDKHVGKIRVLDPKPIWVGTVDGKKLHRYMNAEEAERWIKEDPTHRSLKSYTTAGNLQQL